jgi:hypothetical protein
VCYNALKQQRLLLEQGPGGVSGAFSGTCNRCAFPRKYYQTAISIRHGLLFTCRKMLLMLRLHTH